jgi:hypothetical protein
MEKRWMVLLFVLGCSGGTERLADDGGYDAGDSGIDAGDAGDSGHDSGADPRHDGGICVNTNACPVAWPECQARTCDETLGCGAVTNIREGFGCDDGNANTYGDECASGTCAGTTYACTVNNGGCGAATCIGNDPAPPTCQCSGRYNVTASEVVDTTTGLVWQRTASATLYTHANALTHCSGMGGGWRVPTSAELLGIHTGASGALPRIDGCAFPGTASVSFWTSSPDVIATYYEVVDFGGCCGAPGDVASALHPVRCVR